jgi:hypothetical protein
MPLIEFALWQISQANIEEQIRYITGLIDKWAPLVKG